MTPRKLRVCFATFPYGGNGATSAENPTVRNWLLPTVMQAKADERVIDVSVGDYSDTPVTMTRNRAIVEARKHEVDVLVMVDSDMWPDCCLDEPGAEPFWDVAFDFIYKHWDRGPVCVAAPYCGSPPHENIFVFRWRNAQSDHPDTADFRLAQYTREEADEMAGIQECAALPTGLIAFDMRLFELADPKPSQFKSHAARHLSSYVGTMLGDDHVEAIAERLSALRYTCEQSWFYYEWTDHLQTDKASTEDVTATRDLSLFGIQKYGYNPVHCAWSSWAGHWKPKCVSKPRRIRASDVSDKMARAITEAHDSRMKWMDVGMLTGSRFTQPVGAVGGDGRQ